VIKLKDEKPGSARAERRDAAENRQRILATAIRLFEQFGVEQVSMNQIATEAGIGPGTLYRRYRNKAMWFRVSKTFKRIWNTIGKSRRNSD